MNDDIPMGLPNSFEESPKKNPSPFIKLEVILEKPPEEDGLAKRHVFIDAMDRLVVEEVSAETAIVHCEDGREWKVVGKAREITQEIVDTRATMITWQHELFHSEPPDDWGGSGFAED